MHGTITRGQQAEDMACDYLQARGLQLLMRNYRCVRGEIDLIMKDGASIVFVEVRYRNSQRFGGGAASVDRQKQQKLIATALHYLQQNRAAAKSPARFDVVAIAPEANSAKIDWIPDAFQA